MAAVTLLFCKFCDNTMSGFCEDCDLKAECLLFEDQHPECPHLFCSDQCENIYNSLQWDSMGPWSDRK